MADFVRSKRRLLVLGYNATLTTSVEAPKQPTLHFDQIQVCLPTFWPPSPNWMMSLSLNRHTLGAAVCCGQGCCLSSKVLCLLAVPISNRCHLMDASSVPLYASMLYVLCSLVTSIVLHRNSERSSAASFASRTDHIVPHQGFRLVLCDICTKSIPPGLCTPDCSHVPGRRGRASTPRCTSACKDCVPTPPPLSLSSRALTRPSWRTPLGSWTCGWQPKMACSCAHHPARLAPPR